MDIKTILLIEDSEPDQFYNKFMIEKFDSDIVIHQAYDGAEGLKLIETLDQQPDVIFLDINMPVMDGHAFLSHYSKLDIAKSPVVMLTSSAQQKDKDRVADIECVIDYILKPLSFEHLGHVQKLDGYDG